MEETRSEGQMLFEALAYKSENAWGKIPEEELQEAFMFCEGYKTFLNNVKTEREFTAEAEKMALAAGFKRLDEIAASGGKLVPGMKTFCVNRKKSVILCIVGKKPAVEGINLIGAHIDAPRIDIKQNPLYEDTGLAMMKTHYYGGIKKYQWVTIPLSIHGVVVKADGSQVEIKIGEEGSDDPVFTITDLLPHLAQDQMQKKMSEGITGEGLNLLFGSIPYKDEKVKEKTKLNILKLLNDKYGIVEEDFMSAELEIVPAFKARDVGLDRSMVGSYGQDDRVCAYAALKAVLDAGGKPEKTAVCVLTDKEEIGSVGNTGAESVMLENFIAMLCSMQTDSYSDIDTRMCLARSRMLSADVNPGVDPSYDGVQDKKNASYVGKGVVIQKYTGARGKVGASDANAEYLGELRKLFSSNGVIWQTGEIGKVDQGGGGTIALFVANLGAEVVDVGASVLSIHSPFEITGKVDIYMNYKAFKVFFAASFR